MGEKNVRFASIPACRMHYEVAFPAWLPLVDFYEKSYWKHWVIVDFREMFFSGTLFAW
jgi:hypothetical protein